ncbi:hypothetical protein [Ignatzschineria sp. LJL83]
MRAFKSISISILSIAILLLSLSFTSISFSEEISNQERITKLNDIELKIADINQRRSELQKEINRKDISEDEKQDLTQRLQTLNHQSKEFASLFEQTVLGGIDISLFTEVKPDPATANLNYNWQQEILQILQPFFAQMQRATEKTQQIDLLHEEQKELQKKISLAKSGLNTLETIHSDELNDNSQKLLTKVNDEWSDRLKSLEHQESIVQLKLLDLTDNRHFFRKFIDNLWDFVTHEGIALLFAFAISISTYYGISKLIILFTHYQRKDKLRVVDFKWRLTLLILQAINILSALMIFLVILHTTGNIMLFGLAALLLLFIVISFRNTIPNYIHRLRVFLNLGQAREGERVIYNEIPWEISKINLYNVYLTNPLLDNGELRVTIDLLDKIYSRHTNTDELWFPSRKGDFLLLPDKRIVNVIRQTPESVYLDHNSSTIVMPTAEFYKLKFSNLSRGYNLTLNFTLEDSPEHRLSFTDVESTISAGIIKEMEKMHESLPASIKKISLTVRQLMSSNTTSYQLIVDLSANSAKHYLLAKGALNSAVILSAREQSWNILLTENI